MKNSEPPAALTDFICSVASAYAFTLSSERELQWLLKEKQHGLNTGPKTIYCMLTLKWCGISLSASHFLPMFGFN